MTCPEQLSVGVQHRERWLEKEQILVKKGNKL
jgi:hypothetical protein